MKHGAERTFVAAESDLDGDTTGAARAEGHELGPEDGSGPRPRPRADEDELPENLFEDAPDEPIDWGEWPEDPLVAEAWRDRRARRIAVRVVGWLVVLATLAGLVAISSRDPAVGAEVAFWATMGQYGEACPAARAVQENGRAERATPAEW